MRILGFEWDAVNTAKLALHDLEPDDVEALFDSGEPAFFRHPKIKGRWIALGFVPDERFVLVVFEYDQRTRWVRVVTAYEPTSSTWWRIYAKAKGLEGR
jgi:uncharacterized DUF497 family protein